MRLMAERIASLYELRKKHELYLQKIMKIYCPNLLGVGTTIAARLIESQELFATIQFEQPDLLYNFRPPNYQTRKKTICVESNESFISVSSLVVPTIFIFRF